MKAKSGQNRSRIEVKFEVDFGCDFAAIWATEPGQPDVMRGAGLTQIREFRGTCSARSAPLRGRRIQTLRAFRRAANVDVSKELKSEMTVDEGVPARQLGKPN